MKEKKPKQTPEKPKHVLTAAEQAAIETNIARLESTTSVRLKIENGQIRSDHPDAVVGFALLDKALGSTDRAFVNGLLKQLAYANLDSEGETVSETGLNFAVAVVNGVEPRDQLEAMLAAQMAAVHVATMKVAQQLALSETISQQDSAERMFNKLSRTFMGQMEVLKRYRTGGEQTVTVQHVNVSQGGQAIVGNVTQGQRNEPASGTVAEPLALTHDKTLPMPVIESKKAAPVTAKRDSKKK